MSLRILWLPGDGIGPEVTHAARAVIDAVCDAADLPCQHDEALIGGAALDACGDPAPADVIDRALASDAVFLGAVGGPAWDALPPTQRPERGLLRLRAALGVYANLRPATFFAPLAAASPLRAELTRGVDFVVVRELIGGIYFGEPRGHRDDGRTVNTMAYSRAEIERVARVAFETARRRRGHLTSVDKANVLETMQLWRAVVTELHRDYPDVTLEHMYVDNAAMQLVTRPSRFDVIVTGNLFGDILSDAAAALTGSLGMLPSASLGDGPGLFEPIHGSAPDIAGRGIANPLAAILSAGLLLTHAAGRPDLGARIEQAVHAVLEAGHRTADLGASEPLSTQQMTDQVLRHLQI